METTYVKSSSTPSIGRLAGVFTLVGMTAFGGGVCAHLLHHFLRNGLLSESSYLEALNWSQCLPGCNGTNISSYLGWRFKGAWGAIVSTTTLMLPGVVVITLASMFITSIPQDLAHRVLQSVVAVAVGLFLAMCWKLTAPIKSERVQLLVAALVFILVGLFRIPIPLVLAPMVLLSWHLCKDENPS